MNIIDMSTDGLSPEEIIELRKMLGQHIKTQEKIQGIKSACSAVRPADSANHILFLNFV